MDYIFGAGGHAKVVKSILLLQNQRKLKEVVFDGSIYKNCGLDFYNYKVAFVDKGDEVTICYNDSLYHGIGDNLIRRKIYEENKKYDWPYLQGLSFVDPSVKLGIGCQILVNACVMVGSKIGKGTIINNGAQVDHDCIIGDFSHISPNSTLCGGVEVGDNVLIGAGTIIYPNIKIGDDCIISTDEPIYKNIPDNTIVKIKM